MNNRPFSSRRRVAGAKPSDAPDSPFHSRRPARGMVLILVLVVISLLTLAGLTFSQLMMAEREAVELSGRRAQARALADSGVEATRLFITQEEELLDEAGGWYDNPTMFRGLLLVDDDDPRRRGRYTLVAPYVENGTFTGVRFGMEDESARLNLNTLVKADPSGSDSAREVLMALPGMDEQIADAVLDWIDEDDDTREFGAERDYYSAVEPAYAPKNGPLDTIEELLLVRDVTPWLLFGVDANRNGYADGNEPDPQTIGDVDNSDGSMDRGWAAYLTLYSRESNLRPDGQPKIDLNQDDMEQLHKALEEVFEPEWATFIVAYRQKGPYSGNKPASSAPPGELDMSAKGEAKLKTVLDLVGSKVEVKFKGQKEETVIQSPFADEPATMNTYLPELMDNVAVGETSPTIAGRININQAPRLILSAFPGITSDVVDQIIAGRVQDPLVAESHQRYATWILSEGIVTLDQMKEIMPFVCGKGCIFRAQVIGYFDGGGPSTRIEVVFDATKRPAGMVFWRDMSHLGRGYSLETLGAETTGW